MVLTWSTLRVFEFQICFRVFPRSNRLNHCYQPFVVSSTNHRRVNPRTHVQITSFWYPCRNIPHSPVSDASSRDKIQAVYSDGRRCDRSSPRCGVSVKCPQCGLFCEKVVPVELLESVVLEQKAGCTRESRVHSSQPVLPQGFVLHSFRDRTSLRTRACHSNNPCAEDREVKPEPQQCHQTMKSKVHLMFIVWAPKKLGARFSWNNIKNSALARPISEISRSSIQRSREIFRFHFPYRSLKVFLSLLR